MNKETMNIRAGLKEKNLLDKRIKSLSESLRPVECYSVDNPYIGLLEPTECSSQIVENFQSLNDMIKRREAINKAILEINAVAKIKVKKFISFEELGNDTCEYEEISLANAINRKNYYENFVTNIVNNLTSNANSGLLKFNKLVDSNNEKVNKAVSNRFAGQTNFSQTSVDQVMKTEADKYKVELINPLKIEKVIPKAKQCIEDYVQSIDNALSNATETLSITIEY